MNLLRFIILLIALLVSTFTFGQTAGDSVRVWSPEDRARIVTAWITMEFSLSYQDSCTIYNLSLNTVYLLDSLDILKSGMVELSDEVIKKSEKIDKDWKAGLNKLISKRQQQHYRRRIEGYETYDLIEEGTLLLLCPR